MAVGPEEPSDDRVVFARSVSDAEIPEGMLRQCIRRHDVRPATDGLWHFEQRSRIGTGNYVLQIRPRELDWFAISPSIVTVAGTDEEGRAQRSGATQGVTLQHAVRDLAHATFKSAIFAACAQISPKGWPVHLRMWTNGESVFVRKLFTSDVWSTFPRPIVLQIRQHPELFGFTARRA